MLPEPPPPRRPTLWEAWTPWQLALYGLMLLGANLFWQMVVYQATGSAFIPVLVAGMIAIILPCVGAARWHGQSLVATFDLRASPTLMLAGIAGGLLAWAPANFLADISTRLRPPSAEYLDFLREHLPDDTTGIVLAFAAAALVAPVAEELVFRGLLYRTARSRWGATRAMVLVSLFFGIAHWEPWNLFGLVAIGCVLCLFYEATGSLLVPMVAHATHNTVSLFLLLRWRDRLGEETATSPFLGVVAVVGLVMLAALLRWLYRGAAPPHEVD